MKIPITFTVAASKPYSFKGKKGEQINMVDLTVMVAGFGIMCISVSENKVPDSLEGKTCKAELELSVDKQFRPRLKLAGITGYVEA